MKKTVTNLALNICKIRDILESKDQDLIYKNLNLFDKVLDEIKRQLGKYVKCPSHDLDFTYEDIKALSDEAYIFIQNFQQKFLFDKYHKTVMKHIPIEDTYFNKFSNDIGKLMRIDTDLRAFYKQLGYSALVFWMWSHSEDKKTFEQSLLDTLRSFV